MHISSKNHYIYELVQYLQELFIPSGRSCPFRIVYLELLSLVGEIVGEKIDVDFVGWRELLGLRV